MSDNPILDATLKKITLPDRPEPFVYTTKKGERVVWPDPGDMDMFEAEEFMDALVNKPDTVALRGWVGDEGFEKIRAEKWTLNQKNAVMKLVFDHYSYIFGDRGN